jgi:hypothetical protein
MNGAQAVGVAIAAGVAGWVVADAMRRGKSRVVAFLWGFGVLMVLIVFLPLYLFMRWDESKSSAANAASRQQTLCPYCGMYAEGDPAYCPHCDRQLKGAEEIHSTLR